MDYDRCMVIDAIVGSGFISMDNAIEMEKRGIAEFTGNQWNESWAWKRSTLERLPTDTLLKIYRREVF